MIVNIINKNMNLYPVSPGAKRDSGLLRKVYLAMMMIALSAASVIAQSPEVRKAFRLIDIEQPSKGLAALEQLVSSDPENADYLYYLGLAQIRTGNKDKALAHFEKGISLEGKNGLNYAGKGHVSLLSKNPSDAKVQFDQALKVSRSKDANVLKAIAEAYLSDTKYLLDAISLLEKAKGMNSTDPEIHLLLGDALLIKSPQQGGPAISSYERAASADPKSGKPWFKIGQIWQRARGNDQAIAAYERAIAADPEYAPAYRELGEIYYVAKEFAKAVPPYEKYLSISENPGDARYKYAFFLFMAKDYQKANAIFEEVIKKPDVPAVALRYYAYSLIEQSRNEPEGSEKSEQARKVLEQYFQKAKPEDIQATDYAYLGKLHLKSGNDSLAHENFARSLEMDSTQTDIAQLHAEAYFDSAKYEKAVPAFKILINSRPQPLISEVFKLGQAYYYSFQFDKADSVFTWVSERTPTMTVGYLWAAKSRQQIDSTGAMGLANPMFEKVTEVGEKDTAKNKKDLIDAYEYFGSYYINIKEDVARAITYYEKILALDPSHKQAREVMKALKEG